MNNVEPRRVRGNCVDMNGFREWKKEREEIKRGREGKVVDEKQEKTQENGKVVGTGSVYTIPVGDEKVVHCPKCGTASRRKKCPGCGIPLKDAAHLWKIVPFFGKQMVQGTKVCPACGEPTDGDECGMCNRDLFFL